jgi:hypothetical protein
MAEYLIQDTTLTSIADAIRSKTGEIGEIKLTDFSTKIQNITSGGGGVGKLGGMLLVVENGKYYPDQSVCFDTTYPFKASYTQEFLAPLYEEASAVFEFPMNDFATGAFLIDNNDSGGNAVAIIRFMLGANIYYYGLMKECSEPKFWVPVEVATALGYTAEGWYSIIDENTMAFAPSDIPDYPLMGSATFVIENVEGIFELFDPSDFVGFSSVEVNVKSGGSAEDAVVWTVTFIGADGNTLYQKLCLDGDACYDPVITGKLGTPTKESTPQYYYTYDGWSLTEGGTEDENALSSVTSDRTVYAAFIANTRYYTVRFFDGETILKTESVAYGEKATPPDAFKDGYFLVGWGTDDFTITQDADFYSEWEIDQGWAVMLERPTNLSSLADTFGTNVAFSPDATKLYLSNGNGFRVYDTTTTPYTQIYSHDSSFKGIDMALHPNGNWMVFVASYKQGTSDPLGYKARVLELIGKNPSWKSTIIPTDIKDAYASGATFNADGTLCAIRGRWTTYIFDTTTTPWTAVATFTDTGAENTTSRVAMAFSPDGTRLVSCYNKGWTSRNYHIYGLVDGTWQDVTSTEIPSWNGDIPRSVTYSPDGRYLAFGMEGVSSSSPKTIVVYDTSTTPYTTVKTVLKSELSLGCTYGIAFNHDGSLLVAVGSYSPYMIAFDTDTWERRDTPMVPLTAQAYDCAFNYDGTKLAIAGKTPEQLTVYDIKR